MGLGRVYMRPQERKGAGKGGAEGWWAPPARVPRRPSASRALGWLEKGGGDLALPVTVGQRRRVRRRGRLPLLRHHRGRRRSHRRRGRGRRGRRGRRGSVRLGGRRLGRSRRLRRHRAGIGGGGPGGGGGRMRRRGIADKGPARGGTRERARRRPLARATGGGGCGRSGTDAGWGAHRLLACWAAFWEERRCCCRTSSSSWRSRSRFLLRYLRSCAHQGLGQEEPTCVCRYRFMVRIKGSPQTGKCKLGE